VFYGKQPSTFSENVEIVKPMTYPHLYVFHVKVYFELQNNPYFPFILYIGLNSVNPNCNNEAVGLIVLKSRSTNNIIAPVCLQVNFKGPDPTNPMVMQDEWEKRIELGSRGWQFRAVVITSGISPRQNDLAPFFDG